MSVGAEAALRVIARALAVIATDSAVRSYADRDATGTKPSERVDMKEMFAALKVLDAMEADRG